MARRLDPSRLTERERQELLDLDREKIRKSLTYFTESAWHLIEPGRPFVPGWHIDAMSEHLEAVARGEIRDLVINVPPRHMKSILACVMFPAWRWATRPEVRWIFGSYAEPLALRDSVKCRRIIQSDWYQERFGTVFQLTGDQNEKRKYENDKSGHRVAIGIGGSATGEGGDILVLDDPHKITEAESDAARHEVIEFLDGEFSMRGNDPKTVAKIIIMQRVHQSDAAGHAIAKGWTHLCLPAEFEPKRRCMTSIGWEDPRGLEGELLWPDRVGPVELTRMKRDLGSQKAAGQLQQRPAPAEGGILKRHWWKTSPLPPIEMAEACDLLILSVDLSFDDKGKDPSNAVFGVWGRKGGAQKHLIDQVCARMDFPTQLRTFKAMCAKWPKISAKYVEKKANGAALISTVLDEIPGTLAVEPKGSKVARAEAIAPQCEAGNVFLPDPKYAPWVLDFIEETADFPNGAHDDQVDQTTQAILKISQTTPDDIVPVQITSQSKFIGRA